MRFMRSLHAPRRPSSPLRRHSSPGDHQINIFCIFFCPFGVRNPYPLLCDSTISHVHAYCFIVFKYVILILRREKYILGRIGLYFWGEAGLILGICEARQNTFRELRIIFIGIWGDQCIILREHGSRDSLGGLKNTLTHANLASFLWDIVKVYRPRSDPAKRGI